MNQHSKELGYSLNLSLIDQVLNKVLVKVENVELKYEVKGIHKIQMYFHGKDYKNSGKNLIYAHMDINRKNNNFTSERSKFLLFQRFDFSSSARNFIPFYSSIN